MTACQRLWDFAGRPRGLLSGFGGTLPSRDAAGSRYRRTSATLNRQNSSPRSRTSAGGRTITYPRRMPYSWTICPPGTITR